MTVDSFPRGGAYTMLRSSLRDFLLLLVLPMFLATSSLAQNVTVGTTTGHDENIFDIYAPTGDQITQVQLDAYTDWDADEMSLTASYNGAVQLFRDLPSRNYHVHFLSLQGLYHFENSEGEEDSGQETPEDTSGAPAASAVRAAPSVHSDSADRFFAFTLAGAGQFDKDEATDFGNPALYDNSAFGASIAYREPLGIRASLRPSYTFAYRAYPNISVITNLQHIAAFQVGSDLVPGSWIAVSPSYAYKDFTGSSTFIDTVTFRVSSGHGKGFGSGNGKGQKLREFVFTSPSVTQFSISLLWKQAVSAVLEVTGEYVHFGNPSGEARVIPEQLHGASVGRGTIGEFTGQNEIFDDHFAYSADVGSLGLKVTTPFGVILEAKEQIQGKTYTTPAKDLADSLVLYDHRLDHRYETTLSVTRPIPIAPGKNLKPEIEFHYLRNDSNAPYYAFEKSLVLLGLAFEF